MPCFLNILHAEDFNLISIYAKKGFFPKQGLYQIFLFFVLCLFLMELPFWK